MISSSFLRLSHGSFTIFRSPIPSLHTSVMCAIDTATIRRSKAQLQPRQPRTKTVTLPAFFTLSTSASSAGGVNLEAIMAQLMRMDARLDTFSIELCQVNTRVSRIAWQQAAMCGFTAYSSPSPSTSEDKSDDGSGSDDADEDDGASSPSDDEMTAWVTYPLSFVTKRVSSFRMKVVMYIGRELA